jgi:hypothetical protein
MKINCSAFSADRLHRRSSYTRVATENSARSQHWLQAAIDNDEPKSTESDRYGCWPSNTPTARHQCRSSVRPCSCQFPISRRPKQLHTSTNEQMYRMNNPKRTCYDRSRWLVSFAAEAAAAATTTLSFLLLQ